MQEQNYKQVNFLDLNTAARAHALEQIAEIHQQDPIYDASTAEDFAEMIVDGYNPNRDFMFLQYADDSAVKVTVYSKDFS